MDLIYMLSSQLCALKVAVTVLTLEGFECGMSHHVLVEQCFTVERRAAHLTDILLTGVVSLHVFLKSCLTYTSSPTFLTLERLVSYR